MINRFFLVIVGLTRAFLSILLPGFKTVHATGAIDVFKIVRVLGFASVKTESKVLGS